MKHALLIGLLIILLPTVSSAQNQYFVNQGATGANNGQSWANAFTDLHQALNTAQAGDAIWVAQGVYRPDAGTNRDRAFVLKSGVKLYGGFQGTESSLVQRQIAAHPSILSGNIGNPADSTDNAYTILYMAYPDINTRVDGFTLKQGYAISDTNFFNLSPVLSGGAVYILAKNGLALPVFANCSFLNNVAQSRGGAVFVHGQGSTGSTPVFQQCLFFNNKSKGAGGAIFLSGGNNTDRGVEFDHCRFDQNVAGTFGGAISMENAFGSETLDFRSCTMVKGRAKNAGAFMYVLKSGANASKISIDSCDISYNECNGGVSGLYIESGTGVEFPTVFKLKNSTLSNNRETPTGPGLIAFGGLIALGEYAPLASPIMDTFLVTGNKIHDNETYFTLVGLNSNNAFVKVENNALYHNRSPQVNRGVGIAVSGRNVEISNNVCTNNDLMPMSGAIKAYPNSILLIHDNIFSKNAFLGNASTYYSTSILGAGVSNFFGYTDSAQVFNNVFFQNTTWVTTNLNTTAIALKKYTNNVFIENKDFLTGHLTIPLSLGWDSIRFSNNLMDVDCATLPSRVVCGPNNLYGPDPLFRDTAAGDFTLLPCSPLINAGSNAAAAGIATDLAGQPRVLEGLVDIGAYEAPAFGLSAAPLLKPACAGASDGRISLSPVAGCEPYTYEWSPSAGDGPELEGLPPGEYRLKLSDARGRQILDTLQILEAPAPALGLSATGVQCTDGEGGSLSALATGGTAPYHYHWQPSGADTSYLGQLPPGAYALTVSDANGCHDTAQAAVGLTGALSLTVGGQVIGCHGAADGWLSATPSTGAGPFTWSWSGWPGQDSLAAPLGPGQYGVTVSDAYGCSGSFSFPPLTDPAPLLAEAGSSDQTDPDVPNGAAVVTTVSGGSPWPPPQAPYAYLWSNGGTGQFIAGLTAGTYTVTVTDKNGCSTVTAVEVGYQVGTGEAGPVGLLLWPNPALERAWALLPEGLVCSVAELWDGSGRMCRRWPLSGESGRIELELGGLPVGPYLLRVLDGGGRGVAAGWVLRR